MVRKLIPWLLLVPLSLSIVAVNPPRKTRARAARVATTSGVTRELATTRQYLIEGQGAPRLSQPFCQKDLPAFEKSVKAAGITLLERARCVLHDDDEQTYAPAFRGSSPHDYVVSLVDGAQFNSRSHCELQRLKLAADSNETSYVIESACRSILVHTYSGRANEMFVPVAVVRAIRSLQAAAE